MARAADDNALWRDGYYCCAVCQAEEAALFFGVCYNCKKAGYAWRHCTEPLRPALQEIKDRYQQWKVKLIWGWQKQGSHHSPEGQRSRHSNQAQEVNTSQKSPYWNDDPCTQWLGPLNLGTSYIDGNKTWVLLDDGLQINSVMPAYTKAHDLVVGPLEELASNPTGCPIQGIRGVCTRVIRYVVFWVQIEGIPSYNEEQVTLVVNDKSTFARKVPIILGTPTLHCVINCMTESEMEKAPPEWVNVHLGYEVHNWLYSHPANVEPDEPFPMNTGQDPMDLDEVVKLAKPVMVPAFGSAIVKGLTAETIITGHSLHVMTQAPYLEDEANLPIGLYVLCNYCEIKDSSWSVYLVLRNGTSWPIHLLGAAHQMSGNGKSSAQGRGITRADEGVGLGGRKAEGA